MGYNYRYLRARFKPKHLKLLNDSWVRVSEAAPIYMVAPQTIRFWAFKGKVKSAIFNNILYIKIPINL